MRALVRWLLIVALVLGPSLAEAKTKGTGVSRGGKTSPHSAFRGNGQLKKHSYVKSSVDKRGHYRKAHYRNE